MIEVNVLQIVKLDIYIMKLKIMYVIAESIILLIFEDLVPKPGSILIIEVIKRKLSLGGVGLLFIFFNF